MMMKVGDVEVSSGESEIWFSKKDGFIGWTTKQDLYTGRIAEKLAEHGIDANKIIEALHKEHHTLFPIREI